MSNSRTDNVRRNTAIGLVSKFTLFFMAFTARTIFIRILGADYLGVSSLYTNILSVLSLADLGISNVLMYELYGALQAGDERLVASLSAEFRRIYMVIFAVVVGFGLLLIPVLNLIVNSELPWGELVFYYVLYLANSAFSYIAVYRSTVINADQRSWVTSLCETVKTLLMYVAQTIYLVLTRDFTGYLVIQVLFTLAGNVFVNVLAGRMYPCLRDSELVDSSLVDRRALFANARATLLNRISSVFINQSDSIVISALVSTATVGMYSNYYMLLSYIGGVIYIVYTSITASLGNLIAEGRLERAYEVMRENLLLFSLIASFCCCCYICVVQDFVTVWIGNEYLMGYDLIIACLATFYVQQLLSATTMFRSAMGLFREVRYISLACAFLNVVLSVVFCMAFGVTGVPVASFVALLATNFWFEGSLVMHRLSQSPRVYFALQLRYLITTICCVSLAFLCCSAVPFTGIPAIALKLFICFIVFLIVEYVANSRQLEWRSLTDRLFGRLLVRVNHNKR